MDQSSKEILLDVKTKEIKEESEQRVKKKSSEIDLKIKKEESIHEEKRHSKRKQKKRKLEMDQGDESYLTSSELNIKPKEEKKNISSIDCSNLQIKIKTEKDNETYQDNSFEFKIKQKMKNVNAISSDESEEDTKQGLFKRFNISSINTNIVKIEKSSDNESFVENIKGQSLENLKYKRKKNKKIVEEIGTCNDLINDNSLCDSSESQSEDLIKIENAKKLKMIDRKRKTKMNPENMSAETLDENQVTDEYFFDLLFSADVTADWQIPKLHTMTSDITRHPNAEIRKNIADQNIPHKQGHFTPAEDKIIERNWRKMCIKYNLPDCPDIFARWRNITNSTKYKMARQKAVLFLSRGLPNRSLPQIYHRFIHSIGQKSKGRFNDKEKEVIELFMTDKQYEGMTQQFLAGVLGRDLPSIWRYLKNRKEKMKGVPRVKWNLELSEEMLKRLLRIMNKEHDIPEESMDLEVLRSNKIKHHVWVQVANKMNLKPLQIQVHWKSKLYVQLFATKPVYLTKLRLKTLKILTERKYVYWQDINWVDIASNFDNYTNLFVYKKFHHFASKYYRHEMSNLTSLLKSLNQRFVTEERYIRNRRLQRLEFNKEGKLNFKKENFENKDK